MAKPEKSPKKKKVRRRLVRRRPRPVRLDAETQSDRRTAEYLVTRLHTSQDELADLIFDLRHLEAWDTLDDLAYVLQALGRIRARCEEFARRGTWEG